jgi:hypothetical protein
MKRPTDDEEVQNGEKKIKSETLPKNQSQTVIENGLSNQMQMLNPRVLQQQNVTQHPPQNVPISQSNQSVQQPQQPQQQQQQQQQKQHQQQQQHQHHQQQQHQPRAVKSEPIVHEISFLKKSYNRPQPQANYHHQLQQKYNEIRLKNNNPSTNEQLSEKQKRQIRLRHCRQHLHTLLSEQHKMKLQRQVLLQQQLRSKIDPLQKKEILKKFQQDQRTSFIAIHHLNQQLMKFQRLDEARKYVMKQQLLAQQHQRQQQHQMQNNYQPMQHNQQAESKPFHVQQQMLARQQQQQQQMMRYNHHQQMQHNYQPAHPSQQAGFKNKPFYYQQQMQANHQKPLTLLERQKQIRIEQRKQYFEAQQQHHQQQQILMQQQQQQQQLFQPRAQTPQRQFNHEQVQLPSQNFQPLAYPNQTVGHQQTGKETHQNVRQQQSTGPLQNQNQPSSSAQNQKCNSPALNVCQISPQQPSNQIRPQSTNLVSSNHEESVENPSNDQPINKPMSIKQEFQSQKQISNDISEEMQVDKINDFPDLLG